jgi:hypothetical protein
MVFSPHGCHGTHLKVTHTNEWKYGYIYPKYDRHFKAVFLFLPVMKVLFDAFLWAIVEMAKLNILSNHFLYIYTAQKNKGNTKITHPRIE